MTPRTVLLIEDHAANRELVTELLSAVGYLVRSAGTAQDGLALAGQAPPDLVVLDIGLPGMNGIDALRALRADPRTRAVPALALTAFAMAGDEERILAAGFDAYLAKPIEVARFLAAVERLLQGRQGA